MKLNGAEKGINPRRVRILMAEKHINDIEHVHFNLRAGDNLAADFVQKNPFAGVPVLELDDGSCLSESVAICRYLESQYPEPNLFGVDAREIAEIEMWTRRVEFDCQVSTSQAFRNLTRIFGDREEYSQEWGQISLRRALAGLAKMETRLASASFVAANRFSMADICLICVLDQLVNALKYELDRDAYPSLLKWYQRCKSRPSYIA